MLAAWVSLLVFLSTASPLYTVLFLFGNYWLTRPCVYCTSKAAWHISHLPLSPNEYQFVCLAIGSFLLCCITFSLLDFEADWFEPRWSGASTAITETTASVLSGNATITEAVLQTAGLAVTALNGTGGSLASAAMEGMKRKMTTGGMGVEFVNSANGSNVFEWIRGLLEKLQFRIPCVNVTVRL